MRGYKRGESGGYGKTAQQQGHKLEVNQAVRRRAGLL